ncbi:hypothetical protein BDAP_000440 [Binucleata daphniae]
MFAVKPFILSSLYKTVPNPIAYFCSPNFRVFDNEICVKTLINQKTLQNNQETYPELKESGCCFVGLITEYSYVYINNEIVMVINEFFYCNSLYTKVKPDTMQRWEISNDGMQVLKDYSKNINVHSKIYEEYENVCCYKK